MPYIGNTIRAADDYRLIDDISSGFNGSETSFALQVAGSAPVPFPKSPQQVLISVNGVIQEPDPTGSSGFNLVGTNIVFSSAPTNGHAFFGIIYATADYLNAGGNFPAGSLGAPSITFIGDENSGLFRKSGGSVGFVSDATEIANFDSNGITISSGNLIIPDSIIHGGDTDTKIRFPSANVISFETAGVERISMGTGEVTFNDTGANTDFRIEGDSVANLFKVDASVDNIGIGMASPTFSSGNGIELADNFFLGFGSGNGTRPDFQFGTTAGATLDIRCGTGADTVDLVIDTNGKVGIGTTSPNELLHVSGNSSGAISAKIENVYSSDATRFAILELKSGVCSIRFHDQGDTLEGEIKYESTTNTMRFATNGNSERMRIDSSGRVLIGTTTAGDSNSDNLTINDSANCGITIRSGSDSRGHIFFTDNTTSQVQGFVRYIHQANEDSLGFGTNGSERMRITSSGNVGIGTTAPLTDAELTISADDTPALAFKRSGSGKFETAITIESGHFHFKAGADSTTVAGLSDVFKIESTGNVGIGTTSPNSKLEVSKSDSTAYDATADDGQRGAGATICANNGDGSSNSFAQILFDNADTNQSVARIVAIRRSTSSSHLAFVTEHGNTKAERLRISSDGFIGTGGGTHATEPRAQFNINSEKNALTNTNPNDPHHYTLCLRNDNDTNGEAIGIAFSASSTIDRVGAAIIHKRLAAGSVGELRFYTCRTEGTTFLAGNVTKNQEWRIGGIDENNAVAVSSDPANSIGAPGLHLNTSNLARLLVQERTGDWISFKDGSGTHYGTIARSGSGVSYGSNSDYRLKDNVADLTGGITLLKQLRPVTFNWNDLSGLSKTETHQGFIAHEVQAIVPDAVTGEKDGMDIYGNCTDSEGNMTQEHIPESKKAEGETWVKVGEEILDQQLDTSKLIPILTQALKEAITEIETLKTKVAALEAA